LFFKVPLKDILWFRMHRIATFKVKNRKISGGACPLIPLVKVGIGVKSTGFSLPKVGRYANFALQPLEQQQQTA
jgi:hypothetical protein